MTTEFIAIGMKAPGFDNLKGSARVILGAAKNLTRNEQLPGEDPSLRSG
jgi:hypothetical protein